MFARHAGGLRCLAWVPEVPGGFVTVSDRNGVIRMWNVSQTAPVELLKTGKDGFHSIYFVSNDTALCAFKDGMVSVYNTSRKQVRVRRWPFLRAGCAAVRVHPAPDDQLLGFQSAWVARWHARRDGNDARSRMRAGRKESQAVGWSGGCVRVRWSGVRRAGTRRPSSTAALTWRTPTS